MINVGFVSIITVLIIGLPLIAEVDIIIRRPPKTGWLLIVVGRLGLLGLIVVLWLGELLIVVLLGWIVLIVLRWWSILRELLLRRSVLLLWWSVLCVLLLWWGILLLWWSVLLGWLSFFVVVSVLEVVDSFADCHAHPRVYRS